MIPAIMAALGGAEGTAAAIGAAAESDSVQKTTKAAKGLFDQLKDLASPMGLVDMGAQKLYKSFNALPNKILEVQGMITSTAKNWADAIGAPINTIKELGDITARWVKYSNPAMVEQFNYRVSNTFATIGRSVEPVLRSLTYGAEKVGDVYAKLRPAIDPAVDAISDMIDSGIALIEPAAKMAAPVLKLCADHLSRVAVLADKVVKIQLDFWERMDRFFGMKTAGWDPGGKSDIAVQTPKYQSVRDIQRDVALAALKSGQGREKGGKDPKLDLIDSIYQGTLKALKEVRERIGNQPIPAGPARGLTPNAIDATLKDWWRGISDWGKRQGVGL